MPKVKLHSDQMPMFDGLPSHQGDKNALRLVKERDNFVIMPDRFKYVQTESGLAAVIDHIRDVGMFTFDCETVGLKWLDRSVAFAVTCGYEKDLTSYFIPTDMVHSLRNFSSGEIREAFEGVFADKRIQKINHNVKFDMHRLCVTYGIEEFKNIHHDTEVAQWVLNENEKHDLESVAEKWLERSNWKNKQDGKFHLWPIKSAIFYACNDSEAAHLLYQWQVPLLEQRPRLHSLFYDVEMPTVLRAYEMEKQGITYDKLYHDNVLVPEIYAKHKEAEIEVRKFAGPSVNLSSSSKDLSHVVFEGLGLPQQMDPKKKVLTNSLAKHALAKLRKLHPIIPAIETFRKYDTVKNLFVDKLPGHIVQGRIHTNLHTIGTRTGRMSCTLPNLQQVPKRSLGPIVRRAFVPGEGNVLISMDLSQIELRLLAHFSEDAALVAAFRAGKDIHAITTSRVFGYTMEEIEADILSDKPRQELIAARSISKNINFGILYGMGPSKLMDTANADDKLTSKITLDEAQGFVDAYFIAYPGVADYIERMPKIAKKNGKKYDCQPFVETILGRKRRLPLLYSDDRKKSAGAERQAVNAPIQGSAADFVKVGTLKVADLIAANHWPYTILLQIHDELIMEVPKVWYLRHQDTLQAITNVFQNALPLIVPVESKAEMLTRWGDRMIEDEYDYDDEEVA